MVFSRISGLFSNDLGIDLGTANTLVYVRGEGIVLSEPSVVAVRRGTNRVLTTPNGRAVGNVAKDMIGKTPGNIVAIRPMKDGVIADFDITEEMLKYFILKVHNRRWGVAPRVIIAIPSGITAVEKRAVRSSAERAGARDVRLIEEPMAAGIGAGLPVADPVGSMIVDIGGGTTEVAVISLGGIVTSQSIKIAGDEMDEAILEHLKNAHHLKIGERTAENIKITIGSAYPLEEETTMEVKGRDLSIGLPRAVVIGSEEIREALREPVAAIVDAVKTTLDTTDAELAADVYDRGITLVGGGVLLRGLDKVLAEETGLPVRAGEDPLTCVAKGTGVVLEQFDLLKDTLDSGEDEV